MFRPDILLIAFSCSWAYSKVVPKSSKTYETARFLLDHPRRCFIYMFPSRQTWLLFAILIAIKLAMVCNLCGLNALMHPSRVTVSPIGCASYYSTSTTLPLKLSQWGRGYSLDCYKPFPFETQATR